MTVKETAILDRAIKELTEEYSKAIGTPYIRNPIAYALYHAWKREEQKESSRHND